MSTATQPLLPPGRTAPDSTPSWRGQVNERIYARYAGVSPRYRICARIGGFVRWPVVARSWRWSAGLRWSTLGVCGAGVRHAVSKVSFGTVAVPIGGTHGHAGGRPPLGKSVAGGVADQGC